jgi:Xaa-Pro aminopeptidase
MIIWAAVTPGVSLREYQARRQALADSLPTKSLAIVCASPALHMSPDVPYRFRQNADFNYLTGFPEEDAVLLISNAKPGEALSTLCVLPKDPSAEVWHGPRIGPDRAQEHYGFSSSDVLPCVRCCLWGGGGGVHRSKWVTQELHEV